MSHNNRYPTRPLFGPGKPRHAPIVPDAVKELHGGQWHRVPIACAECPESFRSSKCRAKACAVNRELNEARRRAGEW
jgi:hypothetical protein